MAIYVITGKPRHGKTYFLARIIIKLLKKKERVFSNLKINLGVGALKKFYCNCFKDGIGTEHKWHLPECIVGDLYKKEDLDNPNKLLFYWNNIHEWEHMKNGTIVVDEMTTYFNPRHWELLSEDTEIKLRQHGKEALDIWGTTQHFSRIDVALRQIVEKFIIVKTIIGKPRKRDKPPFLGIKLIRIVSLDYEDIDDYYYIAKHPNIPEEQRPVIEGIGIRTVLFRKKNAVIYDTTQQVGRSESMPLVHRSRTCPICDKVQITHL